MRRATTADLPAIVALLADDQLGATRESPGLPLDACYREAFDDIVSDPAQSLMVATLGDEIVGCLQLTIIPGLSRRGARRGLVESVRIAASRRGQGIGEQMIAWAIDHATQAGCQILQLTTDRSREQAQHFYQRLGFVPSHVGMKLELASAKSVSVGRKD